jgi:hypothetical protein
MTATRQAVTHIRASWRFESMYTLQGKPDQHVTRIPRSVHVWSHTIRISCGQCIATIRVVINRFKHICCTREEGLPTQPTARRMTGPRVRTQLLSHNRQWSSGEKTSLYWQLATRLIGLISGMRSVRSILAHGYQPPSVLNRGLQPWRCCLSTSHSLTFPIDSPPLST